MKLNPLALIFWTIGGIIGYFVGGGSTGLNVADWVVGGVGIAMAISFLVGMLS